MCGGPSDSQKNAMNAQTNLSNTLSGIASQRNAFQTPYLQSRTQGGLPFLPQLLDFQGGTMARQFAPARANLTQRLDRYGSSLPSGFREQTLADFESNRARAFDDSVVRALLLDEETRARAAGLSNPLPFYSAAQQGYGSILGTPQASNPLGSILGGAVSGLIGLI